MEKNVVCEFIDKYYLNGHVDSVIWKSESGKLSTKFVSGNKMMLGSVTLSEPLFPDCGFGIFDTGQLKRMLAILDDNIELKLNTIADKTVSIIMTDGKLKVNFMLSDPTVIPHAPKLKMIPTFDLSIKVDDKFINQFMKGKSALPDVPSFTLKSTAESTKIIIGYSSANTNSVVFDVDVDEGVSIQDVSFSSDLLNEILKVNKGFDTANIQVSQQGLMFIRFESGKGKFVSEYYLTKLQPIE